MKYLALCLVASAFVGCCSGVDPSSIAPAAPSAYQATAPAQRFGVTQEAKSALMIPADVMGCLAGWGAALLTDTAKAGYCILNTITPPPVVPIQTAPAAKASPCASGACAPPPAKAAATPCR